MFQEKDIYKTCKKCGTKRNTSLSKKCPICSYDIKPRKIHEKHKNPFEEIKCINCGVVKQFLKCQNRKFCSRRCSTIYKNKMAKLKKGELTKDK